MKSEVKLWLSHAEENLKSAEVLLHSELYNPCLQNVQQALEKYLKAVLISVGEKLKRTHSIKELVAGLSKLDIEIDINEDDIELIDSIYLPSKYPLGSALPDFHPEENISRKCIKIAIRVKQSVNKLLKKQI